MIERLENILNKYNDLKEKLTTEEVINNYNELNRLSKEVSDLEEVVSKYKEYNKCLSGIEEAKEMMNDPEVGELASLELDNLTKAKKDLTKELEILLIPKDENDGKDVIMEIRGAAGGDEAAIFAGDLFRMYSRYAEKNNWSIELLNEALGTSGGYSQIECLIKGSNVYSKLKYESGAHRVQRIPVTESGGRVHTSTSTVLVMPQIPNIELELKETDLKIDVYHSGGAGGQSVNTTDSAVRMTHLPTNTVVTVQNERSQLKNKAKALDILKNKLYELERQKQDEEIGQQRRNKIGTGDRSEKIRTYNYPQNRVTDHRVDLSLMELDRIMEGNLDPIIEALIAEDQRLKLLGE